MAPIQITAAAAVVVAVICMAEAQGDGSEFVWSEDEADVSCYVSGERAAILTVKGGYNISNATFTSTDQMVINLMLEDQDAQFELPGMLLRVSTAKYVAPTSFDDPFANMENLRQGIWSTVGGNLLGMLFCTVAVGLTIYLEKKFQCVGGEAIHEMVDRQAELQGQLAIAVEFLKDIEGDPAKAEGAAMNQLDEQNMPVTDEDIMMMAGKKVASKAVDGAMVSTMGASKAAAVKKGANAIAGTDEYAEAREKASAKVDEKRNEYEDREDGAQGLKKVKDKTYRHATDRPDEVLTGSQKGGKKKKKKKVEAEDKKYRNPLHSNEESDEGG